jgi:thiol-disulfide isomerase/thioredoxin
MELGMPAPLLQLPDLTGHELDLQDFRGRDTLLLFWNPGCGFCQQMLPDLQAWEADPPPGAPQLLVISTGAVEANQALGLRSPVVLDQAFTSGRAFGATGTPSAMLVDAEGKIASAVAIGAQAVLILAQGTKEQGRPAPV